MQNLKEYAVKILDTKYPNEVKDYNERQQLIVYSPQTVFHGLILDFSNGKNDTSVLSDRGYCVYSVKELKEVADVIFDYFESTNKIIQLTPNSLAIVNDDVSTVFSVSPTALPLKGRTRNILTARHTAMYIIHERFYKGSSRVTLGDVGNAYNRDHATVINAKKRVDELFLFNTEYRGQVHNLFIKYGIKIVRNDKR